MNHQKHFEDRVRGCLLGLAAGDALGTTLEFRPPGSFAPIRDMVGGGPFGLEPGQWTDDTSMALCLAESLVAKGSVDPDDQMILYTRWWREGLWSSTGSCFDIGNTVRAALIRYADSKNPLAGSDDPHSAGNGSLMRLAPVPMFFHHDLPAALAASDLCSRTTHAAPTCLSACRAVTALIIHLLQGTGKDEALALAARTANLCPEIREVMEGSYRRRHPPEIRGSGYVVESLEAALWAFAKSSSFGEGALMAVNLGDDADTTGAIFGQIAGAHYGLPGIPETWLRNLARRAELEELALRLIQPPS